MAIETIKLKIEGMTCGHCEKFVGNIIKELSGVKESKVSLPAEASVTFDTDKISKQQILDAINDTHIYKAIA
jgi:copper chaperone